MPLVDFYKDGQVAIITLANPAQGNVLNQTSLEALHAALAAVTSDAAVRVILLRAQGDPFCLGMDLQALQSLDQDDATARRTVSLYVEALTAIYITPQPVICLVQGAVKAGGLGLVGACDIVLATDTSHFELSEVILGLIPANVLPFIYSLRLPPQKLKYLILTAAKISAGEALRLNLVDEVMSAPAAEKTVKAIIKKLLRASPTALDETKQFTRRLFGEGMEAATRLAQDKILEMIKNPEVIKAIQAFNEGGVPEWFDKFEPTKPLVLEDKA